MRKLILIILVVLYSAVALAANPCQHSCTDQEIGKISYCNNDSCVCTSFDYESQKGYCDSFKAPKGIIFKLCDCDRVKELDATKEYSLVITITTPGVYWAPINPSVAATEVNYSMVSISTFEDDSAICAGETGNVTFTPVCSYRTNSGNLIPGTLATCSSDTHITNYNPLMVDCTAPPVEDQATMITTAPANIFDPLRSYVLIDLPAMFYDKSVVSIGDIVNVLISIKDADTVCVTCPGICSCTASIGVFGCVTNVCSYDLPYLLPQGSWWCGLALANTSNSTNLVTIKFHNGAGGESVLFTTLKPYEVRSEILGDFLADSVGDDLTNSAILSAEVSGTAKSQVVVILGDLVGSYGYKSTCCCK